MASEIIAGMPSSRIKTGSHQPVPKIILFLFFKCCLKRTTDPGKSYLAYPVLPDIHSFTKLKYEPIYSWWSGISQKSIWLRELRERFQADVNLNPGLCHS